MRKFDFKNFSGLFNQIQLTCLIFFLIFSNFSISLTQIFGFTGTAVWILQTSINRAWKNANRTLFLPVSIFLLTSLLCSITAADPWTSFRGIHKFLIIVIFFWAGNVIYRVNPKEFFLWSKENPGSTSPDNSLILGIKNKIPSEPISFFVSILIVSAIVASVSSVLHGIIFKSDTVSMWRNPGSLADILSFSTILMMIALITLSRILFQKEKHPWLMVALGILLLTLLMTLSRQVWAALFVGSIVLFYFKKRILIAVPPVLVIVVLLLAPQHISNRLLTTFDLDFVNNQERFLLWEAGWQIFKDHPVTGCGLACLVSESKHYENDYPILKTYSHLHNNPLQIAVEMGTIGFLAWCGVWGYYFRALLIQYRRLGDNPAHRWVVLGSFAVVIGFLTAGMFENSFYDSEISMVLYFLMALPVGLVMKHPPSQSSSSYY